MRALVAALVACALLAGCSVDPAPEATTPDPEPSATAPRASAAPESSEAPAASPTPSPSDQASTATGFHDAGSQADGQVAQLEAAGRDADADAIRRIAEQPVATWLGEWMQDVTGTVAGTTRAAADAGQVALFVVYAIPGRDCGLHSAGGVPEDQYLDFVRDVADGIEAGSRTWIVLEPDALAQMGDCDGQGDRAGLLAGAAEILDDAGADVFLDAGHSGWRAPEDVIARLETVGTEHLAGFSTNTSNYQRTEDERAWAEPIAAATGLEFIVDTSRNGNGSNGEWCNPSGRALGEPPQILDDGPMRAVAWVKAPGESDGTCNGGPPAGQWWMEGALALAGAA
ncbi:glycoside hydrolase family 6 protein [Demequina activiva]|uniref:Glucanase n=1 Tax=Demequina activiva TaxID=1582364 RepID=A0A919Q443_9MICO|nr:glycoside hydrolase family 6 protein [Demequina activiva]GIG53943.1 glucanase [Demequina activiva]